MPSTLTPLRYPGGKTKYLKFFIEVVAKNCLEDVTFVEVFAGGAGSAISLLLKGHVKGLFLNDLDPAIYSFWRAVKECPDDLISRIDSARITIEEWKHQKEIYDRKGLEDWLSLAFATFYLNRANHSGILHARPIGGLEQSHKDLNIGSRFNKVTAISKIRAIASRAADIEVFNLDGREFVQLMESEYSDRRLLIYFDPPYYQKGPALYLNHLQHEDHAMLRDTIINCSFPWVLSYDNHKDIIDLYRDQGCRLYKNEIRHTIVGNARAEELIVSKLKMPEVLKPIRQSGRSVFCQT